MSNWVTYDMGDLWELLNEGKKEGKIKPKFPTRRWGNITTQFATTDKVSIEAGIIKLREQGYKVRKRIDHELTKKWKSRGKKFYKIEMQTTEE